MRVIDIIVPTLGRSDRLDGVARNIADVTPAGEYQLVIVCDHDDDASVDEAMRLEGLGRAVVSICDGTYPRKVNHGVANSDSPLVCLSGDDAVWHPGWLQAAQDAFADASVMVVGTNDLTPSSSMGVHSTQPIVRRSYITDPGGAWREPGRALHEGYHHNYCETELCQLAQHRGVWAFAAQCVIEHRHPDWGTAEEDDTYRKGARTGWAADQRLFGRRRARWSRS